MIDPFNIAVAIISIVSAGASYMQAKKAQKKAKELTEGVEANIESNSKEIPVVYGERRVGGVRVYIDTSRDRKHKYLYMVLAMAEGEVESITDIRIDDSPITNGKFITSGNDQNLWYEVFTGTDTQTVSTLIKNGVKYDTEEDHWDDPFQADHDVDIGIPTLTYPWSDNHRLQGVAYLALKFKWDENAYTGIPDVTALVKGKKVYDPRTQTTAWSDNPALCIRDYLTNTRYGKGLPASAIDDTAFSHSANDCDNFTITPFTGAGTTQKLFTMDHVVDTSRTILENLNDMLIGCRAFMPYSQGKYGLKIDQTSSSVLSVGADQIISGITIAGAKKEDRFNQVKVNFFNKGANAKEDQAIYPEVDSTLYQTYLDEDEGEPLVDEVDLFMLDNYYSAREMARLLLERSRQNMTIAFEATSELINLEVGDVFSLTHPTPAWTNKLFQAQEITLNFDGTVQVNAIEYDADLYTYDTPEEEQKFIGTRLPDPTEVDPVTDLTVSTGTYIEADGKTIGFLDCSWTAPDDALVDRYEIKFEYNSKTDIIDIANTEYRFKPTQDNIAYTVSVRSVNGLGIRSSWLSASAVTSTVDTTAPAEPTLPDTDVLVGGNRQIALDWINPNDDDFDVVQIQVSTTSTRPADTEILATVKTSYYIHEVNEHNATRYYWIRALDRTGNASDWVALGNATTATKLGSNDLDSSVDDRIDQRIDAYGLGSAGDFDSQVAKFSKFGANPFTLDAVISDFDHGNQDVTITITGSKTWSLYTTTDPRPNNEVNNNFTLTLYRKKSAETTWTQVTQWTRDGASGIVGGDYVLGSTNTYHNGISVDLSYTDDSSNLDNNVDYDYKLEPSNIGSNYRFDVALTVEVNEIGTNNLADNYVDSFSINDTTGLITLSRTNGLSDLTDSIAPYVSSQVSNLVDSAPDTLNTLNELASALGDDANFSVTVTNSIATKASKSGDTFTGLIIAENGLRIGTGNHNTDGRASLTFGEGTNTSDSMYIEYDGENLSGDNNAIIFGSAKSGVGDVFRVTYGGSVKVGTDDVFHDGYHPNADKWTTARTHTVTLTGDVSGTASQSVDGTGNKTWTISTQVSGTGHHHDHIQGNGFSNDNLNTVADRANSGELHYDAFSASAANKPPTNDNANGVITVGQHNGNYTAQLAFSSDGKMYHRDNPVGVHGSWQGVFTDAYHPNADKWTTARNNNINLTGDVTGYGSASVDGTGNWTVTVNTTVSNNSHTHTNTTLDMHFGRQTQNIDTYDPDSFWGTSKGTGGSGTYPSNYVNIYNFAGNGSSEGTQLATYYGGNNKTWIRTRNDNNNSWLGWTQIFTNEYHPNADKWTTARTLSLTGDVTGSVSWDGSANASITTTVANDSHTHSFNNLTNKTGGTGDYVTTGDFKAYSFKYDQTEYNWSSAPRTSQDPMSIKLYDVYTNRSSGPTGSYGSLLGIYGRSGHLDSQLFFGNVSDLYIREAFYNENSYNPWQRLFADNYHPNADKWTTARTHTVTLTGQVTGSASQTVDGTGNKTWSIATTLNDSALDDQYVTVGSRHTGNADSLVQTRKASIRIWDVSTASDDPSGASDGLVLSAGWDSSSWGVQQYHDFHTNDLYLRSKQNGTFSSWDKVFHDTYHPNADKWTTARNNNINLTGDVTGYGSASVDGTGNWTVNVNTTVANDSHNHDHSDGRFTVGEELRMSASGNIRSNSEFQFLTISGNAQTMQTGGIGVGANYGTYPAFTGGVNVQNGYRVNGTTVISSAREIQNASIAPYIGLKDNSYTSPSLYAYGLGETLHAHATPLQDSLQGNVLAFKHPRIYGKSGSTWTDLGVNKNLTDGKMAHRWNPFTLSRSYSEFIIYFGSGLGYSFLNAVTMMHSTNGNSMRLIIETHETAGATATGWTTRFDTVSNVGSWPGSTVMRKTIGVGGGYDNLFRIRIIPNWSHASNSIQIGQITATAGYGSFSRLFNWDGDKNVGFYSEVTLPSTIKATDSNLKLWAGGNHILNMDLNGKIYPQSDDTCDLGFSSSTNRFRNLHLTESVTVNGTAIVDSSRNIYGETITGYKVRTDRYTIASPRYDTSFYVLQSQHWFSHASSDVMYLGESGNKTRVRGSMRVGSNASPDSGYKFQVDGSVKVSSNILANGNVTAYSDITLKDNINEIDNALEKVNSIRGVTYDRIDQDNARHAGVIAQEVEEVLPEVVHTDGNGIKSVAYGNMVGLLIEAIKELKSEIEELKNGNN